MKRFAILNHDDQFPFEKLLGFPDLEELYVFDHNGRIGDCYSFDRWFRTLEKKRTWRTQNAA
jgi:hypothetical protein